MRLDKERLQDILEAIAAIERYMPLSREEFDRDELVRVGCLRHIEIIGEVAANISESVCESAPAIPWRNMIGMRNILIHAYFDVDWNEIWNVVINMLGVRSAHPQPTRATRAGFEGDSLSQHV